MASKKRAKNITEAIKMAIEDTNKPPKKYDTVTGQGSELTGPDTYRAGKFGARVQTGVLRQPLKGIGRRPKIKKPLYRGSPNNRRQYKDRWSGV